MFRAEISPTEITLYGQKIKLIAIRVLTVFSKGWKLHYRLKFCKSLYCQLFYYISKFQKGEGDYLCLFKCHCHCNISCCSTNQIISWMCDGRLYNKHCILFFNKAQYSCIYTGEFRRMGITRINISNDIWWWWQMVDSGCPSYTIQHYMYDYTLSCIFSIDFYQKSEKMLTRFW